MYAKNSSLTRVRLAANNFGIRKLIVSGDGGGNGRLTDRLMSDPGVHLSPGTREDYKGYEKIKS